MTSRNVLVENINTEDRVGEKCGVIAVWCEDTIATYYARKGLSALQHRGQESAGLSIYTAEGKIKTHKGMGLVPNVLTAQVLAELGESRAVIGHNRYSTAGSSSLENAQPLTVSQDGLEISIGHNGNIPDCQYLGEIMDGQEDVDASDTTLIARILLHNRKKYQDWDETLKNVLPKVQGAFCLVIMTSDGTIYGARDPYGIRPFCLGRWDHGWIMASESVALDLTSAEFMRDIKPGEIVKIDINGNLNSFFFGEPKRPQNCIFEYIYFSRPDSFENGIRVRKVREASGRLLAKRILEKRIKADAVVPVFDSGYPSAKGVAQILKLPMLDAITVSHYVGRTFIQPGQANRMAAVNGKHNIIPDEIIGKDIIVVDDSAVRLTTSKRLFAGLKEAGAKKVYMVFASPPVVNQCDLGIDMRSKKELPASQWEDKPFEDIEKNVAGLIGADNVAYLPIDQMTQAIGGEKEDFYHYPFGGPHPLRGDQHKFPKLKKIINKKPKISVLISGSGTNLLEIIKRIESGDIDAEIVSVVSGKKDAKGIDVAKDHNIPVEILPFSLKTGDKKARSQYEQKLLEHIKKISPNLIILAGWMLVLGDDFLTKVSQMQIPVINLHPALLTKTREDHIATSRGSMPVIRGAHAIKTAFDKGLLVSGVSVHQVLAKNHVDIGPVILTEEVRRKKDDTFEKFESRIHQAEYRVLPTAIKRVLHVLKNGIDISKGDFYW